MLILTSPILRSHSHKDMCCCFLQKGGFPMKYLQFPSQSRAQAFARIAGGMRFPQPLPLHCCAAHIPRCCFYSLFFILVAGPGPEALGGWWGGWTEPLVTQRVMNLPSTQGGGPAKTAPCTHRAAPRHRLWLQLPWFAVTFFFLALHVTCLDLNLIYSTCAAKLPEIYGNKRHKYLHRCDNERIEKEFP